MNVVHNLFAFRLTEEIAKRPSIDAIAAKV
jgi:hypothetical protein